jgi:penicillin-binding protein 1C
VFAPVNYDRRCRGPVRYRLALASSLNIPAVRVLDSVGGPAILRDRLRACGLTTLDRGPEDYGLGLTIGNAEARLLELANAYACLARLGEYRPCRLTLDSGFGGQSSNVKAQGSRPPEGRRVFDAGAAWLIADILSDNAARAPAFGLDSPLRFEFPVACKTGTSSDFRDNWALGYTPEFTVGVWVGNFDGSPMERVAGVTGAAPILHDLVEHLHARHGTGWYARPSNVVERLVHPITGRVLRQEIAGAVREYFLAGALPPLEAPEDYDAAGRVRLGAEYREWLASADNELAGRVVVDSAAPGLCLVSPLPGTVYFLDPDVPTSGRLRLRAHGEAALRWRSDSLECRTERGDPFAVLTEGRHRLTVQDTITGEQLETWIEVKRL